MLKKNSILIFHFLTLALLFLIWEAFANDNPKLAFILGRPTGIWTELSTLLNSGELQVHIKATVTAAFSGFLIGTLLGGVTGITLSMSKKLFRFSEPYILLLGSLPVFALGPLVVFWFGTGIYSKIVLVAIAVYSLSAMQSYSGAKNSRQDLIDMMKVYGANNLKITFYIRIPESITWVMAGLKISIGTSLIGAVIGEFIASRAGLGHLIIKGEGLYNMNIIWVGVLCLTLIAIITNRFITYLEHKIPIPFTTKAV